MTKSIEIVTILIMGLPTGRIDPRKIPVIERRLVLRLKREADENKRRKAFHAFLRSQSMSTAWNYAIDQARVESEIERGPNYPIERMTEPEQVRMFVSEQMSLLMNRKHPFFDNPSVAGHVKEYHYALIDLLDAILQPSFVRNVNNGRFVLFSRHFCFGRIGSRIGFIPVVSSFDPDFPPLLDGMIAS